MSWQLSQQDSTASTAFRNEPEVAHIVHRLAEDWSGGYSLVLEVVLISKTAANTGGVFKTLIGGSGVFGTATKFMRQTARQTQMRVAGSGMTITDSGTQITFASSGGGRVRREGISFRTLSIENRKKNSAVTGYLKSGAARSVVRAAKAFGEQRVKYF